MQYNIMPAASLSRSDWFISAISEQKAKLIQPFFKTSIEQCRAAVVGSMEKGSVLILAFLILQGRQDHTWNSYDA